MNAELTEVARRFVACPGWVWLMGMRAKDADIPEMARRGRVDTPGQTLVGWLPDLDDPVTAAGILPVVRRAWGDSRVNAWPALRASSDVWMVYCKGREFSGPSELLALLAALEAAPK